LDTAMPFDGLEGDMGVLSVGETLLRYLDALPQAVIPENVYEQAIRIAESKGSIMEVQSRKIELTERWWIYCLALTRTC